MCFNYKFFGSSQWGTLFEPFQLIGGYDKATLSHHYFFFLWHFNESSRLKKGNKNECSEYPPSNFPFLNSLSFPRVDLLLVLNCNIPNVRPDTYLHVPIDYDDYIDVLLLYWVEDPIAYEHDYLFYILGISQLLMIYIC